MIYAGVDPGRKGAVAFLYQDGSAEIYPMEGLDLATLFSERRGEAIRLCLEKVHSMPRQGVASTFNFGVSYGYIKGVLECSHISYQEIEPQRWKKEFGLSSDKAKSIEVCRKLFPDVSLRPTELCRADSDGMAEAVLMAEYARRKL